jgi:hypothetical protein
MFKETGRYSPDNPNANIHGMVSRSDGQTCLTRDGKRCTGCCYALGIPEQGAYLPPKPEGEMCQAQIPEKGCGFVIERTEKNRYGICPQYHCSKDLGRLSLERNFQNKVAISQRLVMCNAACLQNGEINNQTFRNNLDRIPNP